MLNKLHSFLIKHEIHAFRYRTNVTQGYAYGIGYKRWVLYYYGRNAYGGNGPRGFRFCNYFGTGDGG